MPKGVYERKQTSLEIVKNRLLQRRHVTVDGCWNYTFALNTYGYGVLRVNGSNHLTHRLAYNIFKGELTNDIQVHHICENRRCFNPDHLEIVYNKTNSRYMRRWSKINDIWHCSEGHRIEGHNAKSDPNGIACRECHNDRRRERRANGSPE